MFARLSFWVACLACGVVVGVSFGSSGTRVAFLSVGQGDCTVVISEGWVAVIDVGPRTDTFDAGKRLIVPELRRLGVKKIDCLFLTHPDMDHVGGLEGVASRFEIGRVVISDEFEDDALLLQSLSRVGLAARKSSWISGVNQVRIGTALMTVAAPDMGSKTPDNEGSLFIRIDVGSGSIMTTGDAAAGTESKMSQVWDWDVDVLKAGHHGSKGSMSMEWLTLTSPKEVVASCGRRNTYGHPSKDAVARVSVYGAKFLRTDRDGTVVYQATSDGFVREE